MLKAEHIYFAAIALLGILLAALFLSSSSGIPAAAARGETGAVLGTTGAWVLDKALGILVTLIATTLLGGVVLAARQKISRWVRNMWKARQSGRWAPGPNARWRRNNDGPAPRQQSLSADDLLKMYLLQQMKGTGLGQLHVPPPQPPEDDDLPPIF